jgi:flagellar hook-basal body complex protein FliE
MEVQPNLELLKQNINPVKENKNSEPTDSYDVFNNFSKLLKNELSETNSLQKNADELNRKLVLGEVSNVHDVMIAGKKAEMALEFTLQLRSLLLNAYNKLTMLR